MHLVVGNTEGHEWRSHDSYIVGPKIYHTSSGGATRITNSHSYWLPGNPLYGCNILLLKLKDAKMNYYNTKTVDYSFDEALQRIPEELKKEGFGILTEIDVQATLKKKLGVDFRKYKILGACNPPFAYKALQSENNIGVLLPCNIVVQENQDGKVEISAVNPMRSMQAVGNENLMEVAEEISSRLNRVLASL